MVASYNRIEAAEQKIRFALGESHCQQQNLRDCRLTTQSMTYLRSSAIPIRINYLKLQSIGLSGDNPVSIVLPAMTLQSALRNILSSLSDELGLYHSR